jgi:oligopeptide/dipeptide ABC transporter ATP-binding protein
VAQPVHLNGSPAAPRLRISGLRVSANTPDGRVQVLSGVDLHVDAGEILALVGESGCGKSTTARAVMGILARPPLRVDAGEIEFEGTRLLTLSRARLDRIRGERLTMIFQDPNASLNPVFTVGDQMAAILSRHAPRAERSRLGRRQWRQQARERIASLLAQMRLAEPERVMRAYPFQLSGGMKQRILIAMALLNEPSLIVADEPGSALDVTIEDQILELLEAQVRERQLSLLFITHNLGVARRLAHRVAIMYAGEVVEVAPTRTIFESPSHPYTQGLLAAIPKLSGAATAGIPGRMPDIAERPAGCPFHPRCPHRMDACETLMPAPVVRDGGALVACHLYDSPQAQRSAA